MTFGSGGAGFAVLGLFLAALGIYGVVARLVAQRTIEIGIRMALGARLDQVVRLVLRTGLRITCIGAGIGMLGAIALTRTIATQLPGLETSSTLIVAGHAAARVRPPSRATSRRDVPPPSIHCSQCAQSDPITRPLRSTAGR